MIICTICKIEKLEENFVKSEKNKDGFSHQCKECKAKKYKNYSENLKLQNKKIINSNIYCDNYIIEKVRKCPLCGIEYPITIDFLIKIVLEKMVLTVIVNFVNLKKLKNIEVII